MRNLFSIVAAATLTATLAAAQTQSTGRVLGVVTQTSAQGFIVKADNGEQTTVAVAPEVSVRRVPPGERDLSKATTIQLTEITSGDRVLVRGSVSGPVLMAQQVIVMSAGDLTKKQEQERREWTQRGVGGLVTGVDAKKGEITIRIPSLNGQTQTTTVVAGANTKLRRYAPDSVRFADAKASSIDEIKAGDQLRAKGERNADGTRIAADEIVTGSFRTVAGTVVAASADSVQVKELETGKVMDVRVTPESTLKRFSAMGGPMAQGRPPAGSGTAPDVTSAGPPSEMRPGGPGGSGGGMRRPDLSQMLERLPATTVADLKAGDTVVVSSTVGNTPDKLTAIVLLAGAERLIAMQQQAAQAAANQPGRSGPAANWNLGDMSMMPLP